MNDQQRKSRNTRIHNWAVENTTILRLKLNHNTDADILTHLEAVDNKTGYIKRLIREDMERTGKA